MTRTVLTFLLRAHGDRLPQIVRVVLSELAGGDCPKLAGGEFGSQRCASAGGELSNCGGPTCRRGRRRGVGRCGSSRQAVRIRRHGRRHGGGPRHAGKGRWPT